jgi:hypothetical protein
MNFQLPTIFTEFEDDCICGNREGFTNLRVKIDQLLSQEEDTISLYDDEDYEDCFVSLALREREEADMTPATFGDKLILCSLILIPIVFLYFAVVGAIHTFH